MRISQKLGLNKSQKELDFFDYEIDKDTYRFFDPYYISNKEDEFLEECSHYIESFFNEFLFNLQNNYDKAKELLAHTGEINEICLGMSKGKPAGRGMGKTDSEKLCQAILNNPAFKNGVAKNIEDIRIFIDGIDKDKISDMIANIIKLPLARYTQNQAELYDIELTNSEIGYYWDGKKWNRGHQRIINLDDKIYFLFPKNLISESKRYTYKEYFNMYVLSYLQQDNLDKDTSLVRKSYDKNGNVLKRYVYKKDVREQLEVLNGPITKEWLARFSIENPDVFSKFRKEVVDKISAENGDNVEEDIDEIVDKLIEELRLIGTGSGEATKYHHLISGILEILFYPYIAHPKIEHQIHEGRKRIDIVFCNIAESGFFYRLGTLYNLPCFNIMVECKNYTKDIANPELDQMAGRFSARRGKFGIICCRGLDNEEQFVKRERDTYLDDRGCIIHLTDDEIIELLQKKKDDVQSIDDYLTTKYSQVVDG